MESLHPHIAYGRIIELPDGKTYQGSVPFEPKEKVVMVREVDFQTMLRDQMGCLLAHDFEMPGVLYKRTRNMAPPIPDELISLWANPQERLFLDRKFYTVDPAKHLFVCWRSVDISEAFDVK